jgi:quinol monooxygenase YgiN
MPKVTHIQLTVTATDREILFPIAKILISDTDNGEGAIVYEIGNTREDYQGLRVREHYADIWAKLLTLEKVLVI